MDTYIHGFRRHIVALILLVVFVGVGFWILSAYTAHHTAHASSGQIDVSLSVTPYPSIAQDGDSTAFLIYYQTKGNGTAGGIQVQATLANSMTVVSGTPNTYSVNGSVVTWNSLPDNYGPVLLEVTVAGSQNDELSLQANVSTTSNDSNPSNNSAQGIVTIMDTQASDLYSDLSVTTQFPTSTVAAGESVQHTIIYENNGPDTAGEVVIVASLGDDLIYETGSKTPDPTSTSDTLVWRFTNVGANEGGSLSFSTLASNLLDEGDSVYVYATITSANNDSVVTNNQVSKSIFIEAATEPITVGGGNAGGGGAGAGGDTADGSEASAMTPSPSEESATGEDGSIETVLVDGIGEIGQLRKTDTCAPAQELLSAYTFAFDKSITTMQTIAEARMCDGSSRIELAKMMSNYAMNILNKKPNTSVTCAFNDMEKQSSEMQGFAVLACQLGLMGLEQDGTPAETFNPTGKVNRATFATSFSRLLYGGKYNSSTGVWYAAHIQALKDAGILKDTDPDMQELRGYIMLMMMRSSTK